jgi:hypothetical protein
MSAADALRAARAAGISVTVNDDGLMLEADGSIPDAIVADLKRNKVEILGLLRPALPLGAPSW